MSLAEELLQDLEDDEEEEMDEVNEEVEDVDETEIPSTHAYSSVHDVAKLVGTERYKNLISQLHAELERTDGVTVTAPLEADPQYRLIVQLSQLAAEMDQELAVIHKFVKDKYEKRFPELETLEPNPIRFLAAVRLLGNEINTKGQNKELLSQILAPSTCIVVSVTASTTQGQPLDPAELSAVFEACDLAKKMQEDNEAMHRLVEMRMALIAPNLCNILGAATSALLVSQAGGLAPLARMPSCNVMVLGRQKKTLAGFSTTAIMPHAGFVYFHPFVQDMPPHLRQKMARVVSAKVTLAARVDSLHQSPDGLIGRDLREQVEGKAKKLLEPPPVKNSKALPKPLDKASKKRGGRRVRKMKERLGMTELRKKANRMNFGELSEDVDQTAMGFHLGQVKTGNAAGGRIRAGVVDQKTRVRMSQKLHKQLERQRVSGGATSVRSKVAGTASSVTFTPVQGLEIVNPTAIDRPQASSSTYFSSTASFMKVSTPLPK